MDVFCKSCGERVAGEAIDLDAASARCGACDAIFSIESNLRSEKARRAQTADPPALPDGMDLSDDGWHLRLTKRWFGASFVLLLIFCVAWNGMLFIAYRSMLEDPETTPVSYVFPAAHVIVGLVLLYWALAGIFNRTVLTSGDHQLTLRHGPLPWRGNRTIHKAHIKQLYCAWSKPRRRTNRKQAVRRHRGAGRLAVKVKPGSFQLRVTTQNGRDIELLSGLESAEQSLFLERRFEDHLGIGDAIVEGEVRGA